MIKFRTGLYCKGKIEQIKVISETAKTVTFATRLGSRERRANKRGNVENFFDTWADARDFLMREAEQKVDSARRSLELANAVLGNIKGLRQP